MKQGYSDQRDELVQRLRRVEGQIRGLQRMVEADEYCIDILTQVAAASKALQSVAVRLLDEHLRHCVTAAASADREGSQAQVDEATRAIERLLRS
ncbi:MAG: metal-sensitive transcriptional regulator [Nitriliruptorales bacterium]